MSIHWLSVPICDDPILRDGRKRRTINVRQQFVGILVLGPSGGSDRRNNWYASAT
jgi:hypothetical protein